MKNIKTLLLAVFVATAFLSFAQDSKEDFYGMWTLEIDGGGVGWLEVQNRHGFLDADLLWRGGSVVPVAHAYFKDDKNLVVTRTRELTREVPGDKERKHIVTLTFSFERKGEKLKGVMTQPAPDGMSVNTTKFEGWKLPDPGTPPNLSKIEFGDPIQLFNGENLLGWEMVNADHLNGFKVVDGILINEPVHKEGQEGHFGNLRTVEEYEDFNLKLEVNVPEGNNSGVYLRGMYEIQVVDSYGKELDSHNMGALYSRITPSEAAEKPAGEWQKMDITLYKRHITVNLNGINIIDNQPVYGPTGGAIIADVFKPGPIYLQGDHGKVSYRNIALTPIVE